MTENLASTLQQQRPGKAHPKALLIGSITGAAVSITIASSMSFSTGAADTPNAEQTTTTASFKPQQVRPQLPYRTPPLQERDERQHQNER